MEQGKESSAIVNYDSSQKLFGLKKILSRSLCVFEHSVETFVI